MRMIIAIITVHGDKGIWPRHIFMTHAA